MKWANKYDRDTIRDAYLKGLPAPPKPTGEERSLPAIPTQEKPLPVPTKLVGPRPLPVPTISPPPVVQRPVSPVEKPVPQTITTSPKSAQSNTSVQSHEKMQRTKGSRLGKLFGRSKTDRAGGTSRSTTPLPDPIVKTLSSKDVSTPVTRNTLAVSNGSGGFGSAKGCRIQRKPKPIAEIGIQSAILIRNARPFSREIGLGKCRNAGKYEHH